MVVIIVYFKTVDWKSMFECHFSFFAKQAQSGNAKLQHRFPMSEPSISISKQTKNSPTPFKAHSLSKYMCNKCNGFSMNEYNLDGYGRNYIS